MRAKDAQARTHDTTYLFGSLFLCPREYVGVSCWERRLPTRNLQTETGMLLLMCPIAKRPHHLARPEKNYVSERVPKKNLLLFLARPEK